MPLTKQNPPSRLSFIPAEMGILILMLLLILSYWPQYAVAEETITASKDGLVYKSEFSLATIRYQLDLNGDVEKQMNDFWQDFYQQNALHYLSSIVAHDEVYQVYRNFDMSKAKVETLIGYRVKELSEDKQFEFVTVPAGNYLQKNSVLESWMNFQQLPANVSYELDYDVYKLDKNYNVISQQAFLSTQ